MRGLTPLLFLLGAGVVLGFNQSHQSEAIVFPGLEVVFPKLAGDLKGQGEMTVYLLASLAAILAILDLRGWMRDRQER